MPDYELAFASATELRQLFDSKKVSSVEVTELFLRRIEALNPKLNAYLTVTGELALQAARKADEAALESECGEAAHDPRHVIVIGHVQTFVDVPEATCLGCTAVREAFEAPTFYFVRSCVNCRGLCETERR